MAEASDAGASGLHAVSPEASLYRIARIPDPWAWPDWANVGSDGTFGNRWDDPQGVYLAQALELLGVRLVAR